MIGSRIEGFIFTQRVFPHHFVLVTSILALPFVLMYEPLAIYIIPLALGMVYPLWLVRW
jgi:hypothetical protein